MTQLSTGTGIGPYTLLFRLGKGGMGEVWCASQGSAMGGFQKLVALKLLLGAEEGSNSSVMFFDEAKVAAALQHAAIVPTLDLGKAQDVFYLAMEMVRGPSLTALLQRLAVQKRRCSPAMVAFIGERIASALDYANARAELNGQKLKLVHRDISPHNVLLSESGNVVLSDFGVARTAVQDHKSRYGTVRGKPSYMAPEQVTGGAIDGRTDVFALGTVLYETVSVKRLFGRGNPVKSMEAVAKHEPKPLTQVVEHIPKALADIIHTALQKKPEARFQSAAEMLAALEECRRQLPGASTVSRDLSAMIAELFPSGSFNVDAKAAEAIALIGEATQNEDGPPPDPTIVRPSPLGDLPAPEAIGTQLVWPMADAVDPLAPEAIEAAEAQIRAQIATTPMWPPPLAPPLLAPRRSRLGAGVAAIAAIAAVSVAGTTAFVLLKRQEPRYEQRQAFDAGGLLPPPSPQGADGGIDADAEGEIDTVSDEATDAGFEDAGFEDAKIKRKRDAGRSGPRRPDAGSRTPPAPPKAPKPGFALTRSGLYRCAKELEKSSPPIATKILLAWSQLKDSDTAAIRKEVERCMAELPR